MARLRRGALGGDVERVVVFNRRSLQNLDTVPGRLERDVVVIEEVDRPGCAVVDRAVDLDPGRLQLVLKGEEVLLGLDGEGVEKVLA